MFPSARSVLKSNCPVHTHLMVPGFTLEKLGLYVVSPYCVACMMQALSATRADTYTNELKNTKGSAIGNYLGNQHDIEPENIAQCFRISRKCQNKFDCLVLEMFFFYQRTETNAKQTVRFSSRQIICLEHFLLRLLYFIFSLYIFSIVCFLTLSHIFHHILAFALFKHIYANFTHLKMISERSKRRDFLAVVFISKSIAKKRIFCFQFI